MFVRQKKHGRIKGYRLLFSGVLLASLFTLVLATGMGPVRIAPEITVKVILDQLGLADFSYTQLEYNIVWLLRLPRVLLGFVVGGSLSVCGVAMQALVRNKLADPYVLGISSGASAFATLCIVFGAFNFLGRYSLALAAFIGAALTIILVFALAQQRGQLNIPTLLLAGVVVSMVMEAVTRIVSLSAPNALKLHNVEFWLSGSLAGAQWSYLGLPLVVMLLCMGYLLLNYRRLNALALGDDTAVTLGVNVSRLHKELIVVCSLLAGVSISVSGSIGFIGLIIPHLCRLLVGADHHHVLPLCLPLGGILVVWADVAARLLIAPEELPVGVLTALLGGPFFIILLKHKSRGGI